MGETSGVECPYAPLSLSLSLSLSLPRNARLPQALTMSELTAYPKHPTFAPTQRVRMVRTSRQPLHIQRHFNHIRGDKPTTDRPDVHRPSQRTSHPGSALRVPHSAFQGQTPDKAFFGIGDEVGKKLAVARKTAREKRMKENRAAGCGRCVGETSSGALLLQRARSRMS